MHSVCAEDGLNAWLTPWWETQTGFQAPGFSLGRVNQQMSWLEKLVLVLAAELPAKAQPGPELLLAAVPGDPHWIRPPASGLLGLIPDYCGCLEGDLVGGKNKPVPLPVKTWEFHQIKNIRKSSIHCLSKLSTIYYYYFKEIPRVSHCKFLKPSFCLKVSID